MAHFGPCFAAVTRDIDRDNSGERLGRALYGKIFEDIFCSTLMDFGGDTAYVFIAMIVLSDENGIIKHTTESLARMICKDVDSVRRAVEHLESQDLQSNLKAHGGRRIVPLYVLNKDETRGWLVVNKAHYRDRGSKEDRRDYMREYMRNLRSENKGVNGCKQPLAQLTHTDTDTDTRKPMDAGASRLDGFEIFWSTYPKRAGNNPKRKAEHAYKARLTEKHTPQEILDGAGRYARYIRAGGKEGTEYVLQAATFLGKDKGFLQIWPVSVDPAKPAARRETCDYCGAPWSGNVGGVVHCREHAQDALDGKVPLKVAL